MMGPSLPPSNTPLAAALKMLTSADDPLVAVSRIAAIQRALAADTPEKEMIHV